MSYEIITDEGLTKEQIEQHEKDWGSRNDPPPGLQEITLEEFAQSGFFTWSMEKIEQRYVDLSRAGNEKLSGWLTLKMVFLPRGEGFAMSHDYWGKKVRFFQFAKCYHDWQEISPAGRPAWNCYHYYKCTKCGDGYECDSSG